MTVQEALDLYPEARDWCAGNSRSRAGFSPLNRAIAEVAAGMEDDANTGLPAIIVCERVFRALAGAYYELVKEPGIVVVGGDEG